MNIIVLHGWGKNAPQAMRKLAESLRGKGHTVLQPHMPGFGEQEPPEQPWHVGDYVQWIDALAQEQGFESYLVCGHSFGGRVAIKMANEMPDRLVGMVLIASAGLKHDLSFKAKVLSFIGKTGKWFFTVPGVRLLQPYFLVFWRRILKRRDYYQVTGVMQETFLNVIEEDLTDLILNLSLPTFVIWGEKDRMVPVKDAYFIHESIEGSEINVYKQAGHTLPYEYPEELADQIDEWMVNISL